MTKSISVRKKGTYTPLTKEEFEKRFYSRFQDPAFGGVKDELKKVFEIAWDGYIQYRKSPQTREAGPGFSDPNAQLDLNWLNTKKAIDEAQIKYADPEAPSRVLLINASARSQFSCPGELSKSSRLVDVAHKVFEEKDIEVDVLDLSALTDEPLKVIYPCKACVSTAMPLCNWPCSCYPNPAMGQTQDWMAEIYPRWVLAHGVMLISPVHWYQAPSVLKLMMDRLVCADGGNPDPTKTGGKNPKKAKELELSGWDYPKHLSGRAFSVVTHADAAGAEDLKRMLTDWLVDLGMIQAGASGIADTFIGYYKPYATSHEELDQDTMAVGLVKNAAMSLSQMVSLIRTGRYEAPDRDLDSVREK